MVAKEVEKSQSVARDLAAKGFASFDDAVRYFDVNEAGVVSSSDVLGDGYTLVKDKGMLVNRPMLLIDWHFIMDVETEREYVSIRAITSDNARIRFNDGSTGVYSQIKDLESKSINGGVYVQKGLVASKFFVNADTNEIVKEDFKGPKKSATTFYLSQ